MLVLLSGIVAGTSDAAAPKRFDMGVYDPRSNQAGNGRAYSTLTPGLAMKKTKDANARFVRIPINWDRVACSTRTTACSQADRPAEPTDPDDPAYEWVRGANGGWYDFDAEVRAALEEGLEPVLAVFFAPPYAECNGSGSRAAGVEKNGKLQPGTLSCTGKADGGNFRPSPEDYADFMTAVSRRYPEVRYFQVWNEPNFSAFLKPALDNEIIERYRELVNGAYDAIKAQDALEPPAADGGEDFLVAGGTAPNPRNSRVIKAFSPKEFLRKLVSARTNFDAYATHPYTPGGPRTKAPRSSGSVWIGNLGQLNRILRRGKSAGTVRNAAGLWVTEFSWDSAPPDCRRGEVVINGQTYVLRAVPGGLLKRWVSEAAYRMWRQGVSAMVWGQLKDFPPDKNSHQGGLYRWGGDRKIGRAKGAVKSFRFPFVAYARRGGAHVWGRLPSSKPGSVVIQRRVRGEWRRVARVRASTEGGIFSKRLRFNREGVKALRAREGRTKSVPFSLRSPRVPRGIQPFGCTSMSQWK